MLLSCGYYNGKNVISQWPGVGGSWFYGLFAVEKLRRFHLLPGREQRSGAEWHCAGRSERVFRERLRNVRAADPADSVGRPADRFGCIGMLKAGKNLRNIE